MPLTEEMLNELNKNSLGGYGHHGMSHGAGMTERQHSSAMHGASYDNYGQDPDDFYDMEDVWNNDRYNFGQNKYKVTYENSLLQNISSFNFFLFAFECI